MQRVYESFLVESRGMQPNVSKTVDMLQPNLVQF